MGYPKHSEVLKNLDKFDIIYNAYMKSDVKMEGSSNKFKKAYKEYKKEIESIDWEDEDAVLDEEQCNKYSEALYNLWCAAEIVRNDFVLNGKPEHNELLAGLVWMRACFRREMQIVDAHKGPFPVKVEDLHINEPIRMAKPDLNQMRDVTYVFSTEVLKGLREQEKSKLNIFHKDSAEYKGMKSAITQVAQFAKEMIDKYQMLNNAGQRNEEVDFETEMTLEETEKMGYLLEQLKSASEKYIDAKGLEPKSTQMGRDRMLMAANALEFANENLKTFPTIERKVIHAEHEAAFSGKELGDAYIDAETEEIDDDFEI